MLGLIISPAKTMNEVDGPPFAETLPVFMKETTQLMHTMQKLSYAEAKALWACSNKLAELNYERFAHMNLSQVNSQNGAAAVLAYEGIQYQHLAAGVLDENALSYLDDHLRIISGFYGVLRPRDAVVPYRLEMQAKLEVQQNGASTRDLYSFWGDKLERELAKDFDTLVNLASVEYARAVTPHAQAAGMSVITCLFGEMKNAKFVQRSTEAKATRGSFVRWCAQNNITDKESLAQFNERGYCFDGECSSEDTLVFVRTR